MAASVILLAALAPALAASPQAGTIVPAHSIGVVSLLQPRSAIERSLGKGRVVFDRVGDFGRIVRVRYDGARLWVTYSEVPHPANPDPSVAVTVSTISTRYRTTRGVGVGSTAAKLRAAYPARHCDSATFCQLGASLPGHKVTTFRLRQGRIVDVDVGAVLD